MRINKTVELLAQRQPVYFEFVDGENESDIRSNCAYSGQVLSEGRERVGENRNWDGFNQLWKLRSN